jgi:hypothetical protein
MPVSVVRRELEYHVIRTKYPLNPTNHQKRGLDLPFSPVVLVSLYCHCKAIGARVNLKVLVLQLHNMCHCRMPKAAHEPNHFRKVPRFLHAAVRSLPMIDFRFSNNVGLRVFFDHCQLIQFDGMMWNNTSINVVKTPENFKFQAIVDYKFGRY